MTGYSEVNTAVKAIKNGATDYISKPFNQDEVLLVITNALKGQQTKSVAGSKLSTAKPAASEYKRYIEASLSSRTYQISESNRYVGFNNR
jgi:two-component system response regulator HydG